MHLLLQKLALLPREFEIGLLLGGAEQEILLAREATESTHKHVVGMPRRPVANSGFVDQLIGDLEKVVGFFHSVNFTQLIDSVARKGRDWCILIARWASIVCLCANCEVDVLRQMPRRRAPGEFKT